MVKFTDPDTEFDEAYIDFTANANDGNQDQASYNALLNGFYDRQESTRKRVINYRLGANYDASRGPSADDRTRDDYGLDVGVNADTYFSDTNEKLFWFGGADYAFQDSAVDDSAGFTLGIGYGRVWNATPLAKALRIQQSLQNAGQLNGDISDEAALKLADIIAREDQYRAQEGLDTYRGTWYAEMEDVLRDEGLLAADTLSALGAVRMDDVLFDEPISARRHGWLVRAGVGMQLRDFSGTVDSDPKLRFELEYAKPYGLDEDDTRFVTHEVSSTFLYHLTNQLDLGLTLAANDVDVRPDNAGGDDEVNKSAVLGIRYRVK